MNDVGIVAVGGMVREMVVERGSRWLGRNSYGVGMLWEMAIKGEYG
jgi:hypothetical protein